MPSTVLPSLKVRLPVGVAPETVAVNVTLWPALLGFCEDATVVVVAVLTGATLTVAVPVIAAVTVSVAVMVREPDVFERG